MTFAFVAQVMPLHYTNRVWQTIQIRLVWYEFCPIAKVMPNQRKQKKKADPLRTIDQMVGDRLS